MQPQQDDTRSLISFILHLTPTENKLPLGHNLFSRSLPAGLHPFGLRRPRNNSCRGISRSFFSAKKRSYPVERYHSQLRNTLPVFRRGASWGGGEYGRSISSSIILKGARMGRCEPCRQGHYNDRSAISGGPGKAESKITLLPIFQLLDRANANAPG